MSVTVIVGAQWGDEGKGKVTDFWADDADVVARYQGGNNAGHTVVVGSEEFKFQLLPSGVVHPEKTNVIGNGVVVDPVALLDELSRLRARGRNPRLFVSDRAHVILPFHKVLDGASEARASAASAAIGTTKRGIGPAYSDKMARSGIRVGDLLDESRLRDRLAASVPEKNALLGFHGAKERFDADALAREYAALGRTLAPLVTDTVALLNDAVDRDDDVLLEGAQGTFLDIDHGTYPFVTSSNTTAGGACTGTGIPPTRIDDVAGIVKAYTTRVGEGPFVSELSTKEGAGKHLADVGREFGTVTGRPRRCGWLDLVLLRRASRINGFTGIAITKLDVLSGLPKLFVCEAYELDGRRVETLPADPRALAHAKPVLAERAGFTLAKADVERASREGIDALPRGARDYVHAVESALKVPVKIVGLGPGRSETARAK